MNKHKRKSAQRWHERGRDKAQAFSRPLCEEKNTERMRENAPTCDTKDGPVAKAVTKALETQNVNYILIWTPKSAENKLKNVFEKALKARKLRKEAKDVADEWVLETAVRLHRAGEGAPYTGIKPAGLDEGPVVPRAEKAIDTGDPKEIIHFISETIEKELQRRFELVYSKKISTTKQRTLAMDRKS